MCLCMLCTYVSYVLFMYVLLCMHVGYVCMYGVYVASVRCVCTLCMNASCIYACYGCMYVRYVCLYIV